MLTDAMRHATGTHLAIETAGTIRQSILAGPNTAADIYRVVGQGFNPLTGEHSLPLVTANVSGFALAGALEFSVSTGGAFFFQVSGISFRYDSSRPAGARLDPTSIMIGGEPIGLGTSYSVTMNAFVAALGVELGFITEQAIQTTGVLMFDALRDYIGTKDLNRYETTEGRMVDTSKPVTWVSGTVSDAIPSPIRLEQNFANPFNHSTTIRYHLDRPSKVTLEIFNTLGQRVATLVSDRLPAGMHQVAVDASDVQGQRLPSGVYVYRLIITNDVIGSVAKTRSMVLTK